MITSSQDMTTYVISAKSSTWMLMIKILQVSFIVKSDVKGATRYKWPNPSDEIWIPQRDQW